MEDTYVIEHIKEICKERNWSVYRLAKQSDIPYSSLNAMLKHNHIPTINNLIKICTGFGITLSEFFHQPSQNDLTNVFNKLDAHSKQLAISYIYGLAHKLPEVNYEL